MGAGVVMGANIAERLPLQFRVLYRQFLLRVVDLEALSIQADVPRLLGQQLLRRLLHHLEDLILPQSLKKKMLKNKNKMKMELSIQDFAKPFKKIIPPTIFLGA